MKFERAINLNKKGILLTSIISGIILAAIVIFTLYLLPVDRRQNTDDTSPKQIYDTYNGFQSKTALWINDEAVSVRELQLWMERSKSQVAEYFINKYSAVQNEKFWLMDFDGEIPIEFLRKKAVEENKSQKVKLLLMKKNNVISDASYGFLLKSLKDENETRYAKRKKGEVIYGPTSYKENEYYDYFISNKMVDLKDKLKETDFNPRDAELKEYYTKNISKYKKGYLLTLEKIKVPYSTKDEETNSKKGNSARENALKAKDLLLKDEDISKVAASYSDGGKVWIEDKEILSVKKSRTLDMQQAKLVALEKGQISDVLEEKAGDDKSYFIVARVLDKKDIGYYTLDEIKSDAEYDCFNEKLQSLINEQSKEAKTKINPDVYSKVMLLQQGVDVLN